MLDIAKWRIFGGTVSLKNEEMKVDHVDVDIIVRDTASRDANNQDQPFYFTDLQFQPGAQKTGWVPNTQELLQLITFDVDEKRKYLDDNGGLSSYYQWKSVRPTVYPGMTERMFNILGRGHEVITIPNDLPEEIFWQLELIELQGLERPVEILSTGIDFKIIPKDDYDLMRISTDVGGLLPEEERPYQSIINEYSDGENVTDENVASLLVDHPLHYRYTREFYFTGGQAGDELEVLATIQVARQNGQEIERQGIRSIQAGDMEITLYKNRFHLIPRGSVRFRVEFFKQSEFTTSTGQKVTYMADAGIGFHGIASYKQWTYGVERL